MAKQCALLVPPHEKQYYCEHKCEPSSTTNYAACNRTCWCNCIIVAVI
jgi:hypothetical protein